MPWTRYDTNMARVQLELSILAQEQEELYPLGWPFPSVGHGVYSPTSKQVVAQHIVQASAWYDEGHISTDVFIRLVKDLAGGA